jgi:starvation-inducible DNA-binding protein
VLPESTRDQTVEPLQQCLTTLIDLALQLKQAHWNLVGDHFLSFHVQLDSIIEFARAGSDEVAERIAALGIAADGRAATVDHDSKLHEFPEGKQGVEKTVTMVADRLAATSECLRASIRKLGELDPVSEDLLIGICATIEKHLWMVQSQEL